MLVFFPSESLVADRLGGMAGIVLACSYPLLVPDILVLQHFRDHRLTAVTEPQLTEGFHLGLQSVDHAQDTHCGVQPVLRAHVQVRPYRRKVPLLVSVSCQYWLLK